MMDTSAIQDRLQTAEQAASIPSIAFCQLMGLEMAKLDEPLWNDFMSEAFELVTRYKWAQSQQPMAAPPHPPPVPQLPMQLQPQLAPVWPWSTPPQPSPSYRQQQPWQPAPSTSTDVQHPGCPPYAPNLSALSTSGLLLLLQHLAHASQFIMRNLQQRHLGIQITLLELYERVPSGTSGYISSVDVSSSKPGFTLKYSTESGLYIPATRQSPTSL